MQKQSNNAELSTFVRVVRASGYPLLATVSIAVAILYGFWTQPNPRDAARVLEQGMTVENAILRLSEVRPFEVEIAGGSAMPIQTLKKSARLKNAIPPPGIEHFSGRIQCTSFHIFSSYVLMLHFSNGKLAKWDYGYLPG